MHLGPDPLPAVRPLGGLYTFSFLALGGRNCEPAGPRRSAVRQHPQQHLAVFGGWPLNTYSAHYTNGACHVPHAAQDAARQSKLRALLRPLCTLVDASWRYIKELKIRIICAATHSTIQHSGTPSSSSTATSIKPQEVIVIPSKLGGRNMQFDTLFRIVRPPVRIDVALPMLFPPFGKAPLPIGSLHRLQ